MSKLVTYTTVNVKTAAGFSKAVETVFAGMEGRFKQVQQLLDIAVRFAMKDSDFSWLSQLFIRAEAASGINLDKLALWVNTALTQDEEGDIPALAWNEKERKFTKAKKGSDIHYHADTKPWYELGRKPKIADSFNLAGALEALIKRATKEAAKGALSEKDLSALNRLAGIRADIAPAPEKSGTLTAEEAAAEGVC